MSEHTSGDPLGDEVAPVRTVEVRLLEGPNLYFPRPAVAVTVELPGYAAADAGVLRGLARCLRLRSAAPGEPNSEQRQRFLVRIAESALRALARGAGTSRLGVRSRPGSGGDTVVLAAPWRYRHRSEAMGEAIGPLLQQLLVIASQHGAATAAGTELSDRVAAAIQEAAAPVRAVPAESPFVMRKPRVPVISITGTNGKTTTTRLIAHIGMTAGLRTGWSSTDGVLVQGELIEKGDYSGPGGARAVLASPGVQLGVLETARGGLLLRGMGVPVNDVSLVTNVSADHLGERGIDTLDQLAEVKSIVTHVTKPDGWCVLNGDDPRVWAMRHGSPARPWCFSLDPSSPSLRESLQGGGRGITLLDGRLVVLEPDGASVDLVPVIEIPMTLAGLSQHNVANALAGAAGALALGIDADAVRTGLRTFTPDAARNPGRMNVHTVPVDGGQITVVLDMAHNESGLDALLTVASGLCPPGARVLLGLGTGGDRPDEVLVNLGEAAGLRADLVRIQHKQKYLRGRDPQEMTDLFAHGMAAAGAQAVGVHDTEQEGLAALLADARDGDVIAFMVHQYWDQLHQHLLEVGGHEDDEAQIAAKAAAARG
ncbi:Mur ligase family protein [Dermacoccaceae bacterium W4C1]